VTLTEQQLEQAREDALAALERAGVPRDLVVLGLTNPHDPEADGTLYESHIGATHDRDNATLLNLVAKTIVRETALAAEALIRRESCPRCGSPRLALTQQRRASRRGERPGVYIEVYDDCLDCPYRVER
jgi:hypothetical protein